ncbi:hypothetical protein AOLI_G00230150 [Acnodon oligacanthus]
MTGREPQAKITEVSVQILLRGARALMPEPVIRDVSASSTLQNVTIGTKLSEKKVECKINPNDATAIHGLESKIAHLE